MSTQPDDGMEPFFARNVLLGIAEIIIAVFVGFIVARTLAGSPFAEPAGLIVGSFGVLHGVHRVLFSLEVNLGLRALAARLGRSQAGLSDLVDEKNSTIIAKLGSLDRKLLLSSIDRLYDEIDVEFAIDKDRIISEAKNKLSDLAATLESSPMEKGMYYGWISGAFERSKSGDKIYAISRMKSSEWDDTPEERRFLEENVRAAENGVTIERIFVAKSEDFENAKSEKEPTDERRVNAAKVIRLHSEKGHRNIVGRLADEQRIQQENPSLLVEIGDGFLMFEDGQTQEVAVLIDNFTDNDEARGSVHKREAIVSKQKALFKQLSVLSEKF